MHTIQAVADRTGLTPDVIRVWERRYQAVIPQRTRSNQRSYTEEDIARLSLLKRLTDAGLRISNVARLATDDLQNLLAKEHEHYGISTIAAVTGDKLTSLIDAGMKAIVEMDTYKLETLLQSAVVELGTVGFLTRFLDPLLVQVGDQWRGGSIRTCQEHFSSAHIRSFIGRYMLDADLHHHRDGKGAGPRIIVGTPPGHAHELGACMAALVAAQSGWSVIYLGASVPAEEFAYCADCKDARAVTLSVSYPSDDPKFSAYVEQLCEQLPKGVALIVGGASSRFYLHELERIGANQVNDLGRFAYTLDLLRKPVLPPLR